MGLQKFARPRLRRVLLVSVLALALQAGNAAAAQNTASEAGIGVGAALCSLVYGPAKLTYALLGTIFGGMAWGLSGGDRDVLDAVVMPAVRGDYVVTPEHLRGEKPLVFIGHRPGYDTEPEPAPATGTFEESY